MHKLLSKEANVYHSLHQRTKENISIEDIQKEIDIIIKTVLNPLFSFWINKIQIDVKMENKEYIISEYIKKTYKKPNINIYYNSVILFSEKFDVPIKLILINAICYSLCKAFIEWDKKENLYLLDVDDVEIYCEQFAYNIYCRDSYISNDINDLINKINNFKLITNEETGNLPLIWYPDGINMPKDNDNVNSIFGRQGDNKKRSNMADNDISITQDDDGIFYTEDEIYDIKQQYKIWCIKNNKTPINTDNLSGKYITYIKNISRE
jgi:hypothetical protein